MAAIRSRQALIQYVLRRLGHPVIEVNVETAQLEDRLDDAIQYFQEYNSDATIKTYLKHQITEDDITNRYIPIPETIAYVESLIPFSQNSEGLGGGDGLFSSENEVVDYLASLGAASYTTMTDYVMIQQYLSLMEMIFGREEHIRYNRHMGRLYLDINWKEEVRVGQYIVVCAEAFVSPEEHTRVYNDRYLKDYFTELVRLQWATNLSKFEGVSLPGGITINSQRMYDEARENLERLRLEIRAACELPIDFIIG